MDRNPGFAKFAYGRINVALRKESVDRNLKAYRKRRYAIRSLSARRAWIEIIMVSDVMNTGVSLSARRAWIEIKNGGGVRSVGGSRSPQGERG